MIDDLLRAVDRAYQEKRFGDAEEHCLKALALEPDNPQALLMQSVLLGKRGDLTQAIEAVRRAVGLSPDFAEANIKLAMLLRQTGQTSEAISACERFTQRAPNIPVTYGILGLCHMDRGQYADAAERFRQAVALDPKNLTFRQNLAAAFEKLGRKGEAAAVHRQSLAISGSKFEAEMGVGALMLSKGRLEEAIAAYRRAVQAAPDSFEANCQLGIAYSHAKRSDDAASALRRAVELKSNDSGAQSALGAALQELGSFDEALVCFERAMELEPRRAHLYLRIASSKKITENDRPMVDRMYDFLAAPDLSYIEQCALHYALAKAYDDLGDYQNVLPHLDEAARITIEHPAPQDQPFNRMQDDANAAFGIAAFNRAYFASHEGFGSESELPVLIIGSPRSGTTLLDRIVSSHPDVGSAGEQLFWTHNVNAAFDAVDGAPDKAQEIAAKYLDVLRRHGHGKRRVLDKMPTNYGAVPIIHVLFPRARFIHIRRHPVDTCISLYMNAHSMPVVPFGRSREDIVYGYKNYLRVVDNLRRIMPADRFIEIDYEAMVTDQEAVTRRVIEFCGLDWDDACLDHGANTRSVVTPSLWQVRQPIYSTSVERWRRYEPWLGAFGELLASGEA